MKSNVFLITCIFFFANYQIAFSQQAGNFIMQKNNKSKNSYYTTTRSNLKEPKKAFFSKEYVTLKVNVMKNVYADAYIAIFNMTQLGATAQEADQITSTRFQNFSNEIQQLGVTKENIHLDMVSLMPIYEFEIEKKLFSKNYNEVPKGFEIQKNIHVKFTDNDVFEKIVKSAAKNEIYDLVKVDYFVEDIQKHHKEIRNKSIEILKEKRIGYNEMGLNLDTLPITINEQSDAIYPAERYEMFESYSASSLDAVKKRSEVKKVRKPKTLFYSPVKYNEYDCVINPIITKPVIQFTFSLQVNYSLKKEVKVKKEIIYITSEGQKIKITE